MGGGGEHSLGSGFPVGEIASPLTHDFACKVSSVLYLLRQLTLKRDCPTPAGRFLFSVK